MKIWNVKTLTAYIFVAPQMVPLLSGYLVLSNLDYRSTFKDSHAHQNFFMNLWLILGFYTIISHHASCSELQPKLYVIEYQQEADKN